MESRTPDAAAAPERPPRCEASLRGVLDVESCISQLEGCGLERSAPFAVTAELRSSLLRSRLAGCQSGELHAGRGLVVHGREIDAGVVAFRTYPSSAPLLLTTEATLMCGVCSGVLVYDGGWERVVGAVADDVDPSIIDP